MNKVGPVLGHGPLGEKLDPGEDAAEEGERLGRHHGQLPQRPGTHLAEALQKVIERRLLGLCIEKEERKCVTELMSRYLILFCFFLPFDIFPSD